MASAFSTVTSRAVPRIFSRYDIVMEKDASDTLGGQRKGERIRDRRMRERWKEKERKRERKREDTEWAQGWSCGVLVYTCLCLTSCWNDYGLLLALSSTRVSCTHSPEFLTLNVAFTQRKGRATPHLQYLAVTYACVCVCVWAFMGQWVNK